MPKQTLRQAIDELRDNLDGVELKNPEKVNDLLDRIDHQLVYQDVSDWDEDIISEVEMSVIEFEDQHPMVAGALKSIMNALHSIGV
ncbi:DUF4404 family protein [Litoribacillus peritrichatus]|uniref:DUF4404 family protein n=1 Tax=Litoribacillus peritrichatus TaxID=718191 RepID=A0ABP7M4X0_9GAMM